MTRAKVAGSRYAATIDVRHRQRRPVVLAPEWCADVEVLRLGPGDHFGEIGVLTDRPSTATIIVLTPVTPYELAKVDLGRIVKARPEVAHELAGAIARRQAAGLTVGPAEVDVGVPPHRLPTGSPL